MNEFAALDVDVTLNLTEKVIFFQLITIQLFAQCVLNIQPGLL